MPNTLTVASMRYQGLIGTSKNGEAEINHPSRASELKVNKGKLENCIALVNAYNETLHMSADC